MSRAVQDLRKQVGLELDERIDLWLDAPSEVLAPLEPFLARLIEDTLSDAVHRDAPPMDVPRTTQEVNGGQVAIGLRGREGSA
jgi:hypothetical protein